jgi:hypothetical protein
VSGQKSGWLAGIDVGAAVVLVVFTDLLACTAAQ